MKPATRKLIVLSLGASIALQLAPAHSGMLAGSAEKTDRERIATIVEREEVRAQLVAHGVDPEHAKARLAALTDEEAALLAAKLDALPAGANNGAAALVGFVAVLVFLPVILVGALVFAIVKSASAGRAGGSK